MGVLYEPTRIRKEAQAKADASLIEASNRIEIGDLERRALTRFVCEQAREQKNIETITAKALPDVVAESDPSKVDEDWISEFFSKCRRVSNEEMQSLWARILAGEANSPGSVSKRTVDFIATMDRRDAECFGRVCSFSVNSFCEPLIFEPTDAMVNESGILWPDLAHLENIGLIKLSAIGGFVKGEFMKPIIVDLAGEILRFEASEVSGKRQIDIGKVIFTRVGHELRRFVQFEPPKGYREYCLKHWLSKGRAFVSSPYPKAAR